MAMSASELWVFRVASLSHGLMPRIIPTYARSVAEYDHRAKLAMSYHAQGPSSTPRTPLRLAPRTPRRLPTLPPVYPLTQDKAQDKTCSVVLVLLLHVSMCSLAPLGHYELACLCSTHNSQAQVCVIGRRYSGDPWNWRDSLVVSTLIAVPCTTRVDAKCHGRLPPPCSCSCSCPCSARKELPRAPSHTLVDQVQDRCQVPGPSHRRLSAASFELCDTLPLGAYTL